LNETTINNNSNNNKKKELKIKRDGMGLLFSAYLKHALVEKKRKKVQK
jgi:hypothetical protein